MALSSPMPKRNNSFGSCKRELLFPIISLFVLQVIIIHSSDTDGRAILGRFQTTSQTYYDDIDVRATVEMIVEFEPKLESFAEHLIDMKTAQSRVYLVYVRLVCRQSSLSIRILYIYHNLCYV